MRSDLNDMLMKRIFPFLVIGLAVIGVNLAAQAPAPPTPQAQGAGRAPAPARDPANTTNERDHVQIDQFFGDANDAPAHLSHGGLLTRAMLRKGNPNVPGPAGA